MLLSAKIAEQEIAKLNEIDLRTLGFITTGFMSFLNLSSRAKLELA